MYSKMTGATPLTITAGTAAETASSAPKGASNVAAWSNRGASFTVTSVTSARVPSEPTMSWVRS